MILHVLFVIFPQVSQVAELFTLPYLVKGNNLFTFSIRDITIAC
jgi:hypothetical protein